MQIIHHLQIDLARRMPTPPIGAVQNEINTRAVSISLLENGAKWEVPEGVTAAVAFQKPDGKKGLYDQLPDGSTATAISGSTVTAILAPQTLTCAGTVLASIVFYDNDMDTLATFPFKIIVEQNPAAGEQLSNNYYYLQNMEQVNTAYNELLERMDALEQSCRVLYVGAEQPNDGTLYWLDTSEYEPITPDVPEKTLASISAVYSGGDVAVGTAVADLTGIVVTAQYSDGSTETVTGYTLSGTIAGGSNTVTVTYQGMTTTFAVTGVAESGGEEEPDEPEVVTYTITNTLTNVTNNNSATSVDENASYTATLTADTGYELDTVTVTMGGTDVTSTVYADGVVTISAVTGNVVITATAVAQADNNLVESNIIVSGTVDTVINDNEAFSDVEYVYYVQYPTGIYQKKVYIRARYTSSYGYTHILNGLTVTACNNGDSDIAVEAYDHYDDRGYVVFKIHIPTLLEQYQLLIDDGTLDSSKGTPYCYFHYEYANNGYILKDYFG